MYRPRVTQRHTRSGKFALGRGSRRRTRDAIVNAAAALLNQGSPPSATHVAKLAGVSRRTIYSYFPTLHHLFIDASLLSVTARGVERSLTALEESNDVEDRVDAMTRSVHGLAITTESHGRTLVRLALTRAGSRGVGRIPLRGYRRVEWIERAVAPLRKRLKRPQVERLISALAMIIGWEALIVQRDLRGLNQEECREVSAWAARALVRAALADAGCVVRS